MVTEYRRPPGCLSARINDAIGKLVASVYHKLSYIDTAMSESDIKKLFTGGDKRLTLEGTEIRFRTVWLCMM